MWICFRILSLKTKDTSASSWLSDFVSYFRARYKNGNMWSCHFAFALHCGYFFTFFTNQQPDLRLYFCLLHPFSYTHFLLYFWTSYRFIDIFIHTALHSHRLQLPNTSVHCLCLFKLLAPKLFFLILAHPVYKMWIIREPNTLELWNKLHFEEEKTGGNTMFKIFGTYICRINI